LVTGGTGLVGRHLVDGLLQKGWDVAVLTRDPSRAKDLESRGIELVAGDVTRPTFDAAMSRADVVFHAAGWFEMGVRDVRRMFDINVAGTANVLASARKQRVPRVLYTGTAGVFAPNSLNHPSTEASPVQTVVPDPYVTSKVQAHEIAVREMAAGLPLSIIAPAAVFGPYDTGQLGRTLALLTRDRFRRLPKGFGFNTWTHAADVADAHILAATRGKPHEMYLIGDRVLSVVDFYAKAAAAVGIDPPRANVPRSLARLAARVSEAGARRRGETPILSRAALDLAAVNIVVDASKARRELGWTPQPLEDRIRETMEWYSATYRDRRASLPAKPGGASG